MPPKVSTSIFLCSRYQHNQFYLPFTPALPKFRKIFFNETNPEKPYIKNITIEILILYHYEHLTIYFTIPRESNSYRVTSYHPFGNFTLSPTSTNYNQLLQLNLFQLINNLLSLPRLP